MVCSLKKHQDNIFKVQFVTDHSLVSCGLDKTIYLWEIKQTVNSKGEICYKAKDIRRIKTTKLYVDITVTPDRFICRNNEGSIKVIKYTNLKRDLKSELFTEEHFKSVLEIHNKGKDKDTS